MGESGGGGVILHVTTRAAWDAAQRDGALRAESLDREGFIHCCTEVQLAGVLARFFRGRSGLIVLELDESRLDAEVKWEPAAESPDGADRFPHVYGAINSDAVVGSRVIELG